jgi:hypothetical protein
MAVSESKPGEEPWKLDPIYNGFGGRLCPDCEVPAGEKHFATCDFLEAPRSALGRLQEGEK